MPTNYVDNVPLADAGPDTPRGSSTAKWTPPSTPPRTPAPASPSPPWPGQIRNTESGQRGIFCEVCHTDTETRYTPYHNYVKSGTEYVPTLGTDAALPGVGRRRPGTI